MSTLLYDVSTLLCVNFMVLCDNGSSPGYFGFSPLWRGDAKTASAPEEYKGIHTFQFKTQFCSKLIGYIE